MILNGNLAPEGCVTKISGHERLSQRGPARVFDSEEDAMSCGDRETHQGGRYSGDPLRGSERRAGHAGDVGCDQRRLWGRAWADRGLVDRRPLQRRTRGLMMGHVSPEAAVGGTIAAVHEGDTIHIDINQQVLEVELSDAALRQRMAQWKAPQPRFPGGVFGKYAALVSSASEGAITKPR